MNANWFRFFVSARVVGGGAMHYARAERADSRARRSPNVTTIPLAAIAILVAGALGGIARVWVASAVAARLGEGFPWGTLAVNLTGAAALGLFAGVHGLPAGGGGIVAALVAIGFLGSYTTVSSFALQTVSLARAGDRTRAALNVLATLGLGLAAAAAGFLLGGLV